jgi:hypothetical protein
MDAACMKLFMEIGITIPSHNDLSGIIIPRDMLLSDSKYDKIKVLIPDIKQKFSSSYMTSLQNNASIEQKWPLLNLIRQVCGVYGYKMRPIRKSDGYTANGVKKYKRFFELYKNDVLHQ